MMRRQNRTRARGNGLAFAKRRALPIAAALLGFAASSTGLGAQLRYDREYPTIPYSNGKPTDAVTRFWDVMAAGSSSLENVAGTGYLKSVLKALDIPVESQTLVFTRTSFLKGLISAATPRAIYFNDETYLAWIPRSEVLEIVAVDPLLGVNFYTVNQAPAPKPVLQRQTYCLGCHDTYGLTGDGVPELLTGSMLSDQMGNSIYHEGWMETSYETPLRQRWGGWYVTGMHGTQTHMGNVWARDGIQARSIDFTTTGNRTDLTGLFDTSPYPSAHSDIVALMVFEHQIVTQNLIINLNYRLRTLLNQEGKAESAVGPMSPKLDSLLTHRAEPLVRALFFGGETVLTAPIKGTSGFAEVFTARGPRDPSGRSLRDFDLTTRMFKYPLSYLIYSNAFNALPPMGKAYVYRRIKEILDGQDQGADYARLTAADRQAIREILQATKPEVLR
jgi:hypothetical protein